MAKKDRVKLDLNLEELFPGSTIDICGQVVVIRPLGLWDLANVVKKLKGFASILKDQGVSLQNFKEPEHMFTIASTLLEQFPEVLEEASNIDIDSLKALPLDVIVQILNKVIDVNLEARESLEKNFESLTKKFQVTSEKKRKSRK